MPTRVRRIPVAVLLAALWVTTKAFSVWMHVIGPNEYSDLTYYFAQCQKAAAFGGLAAMVPEYPTPAAALLMLPWWLGLTTPEGYRVGFVAIMLLVDAVFAVILYKRTSPIGVVAWVLLTAAAERLALLRFDLVPAVLAGIAVLMILQRSSSRSSIAVAAGTAFKVWPIVLFPLTLGERGKRLRAVIAFAVTGAVLAGISVAAAGLQRLFSPLTFQTERGLQIESVAATIPMIWRLNDPAYQVYLSKFNAFELSGPDVAAALRMADVATIVGVVAVLGLLAWWFRTGCRPDAAAYLALFEISVFMVTSKVLSPQYFLWLAAPVAVILGVACLGMEWRDRGRPGVRRAGIAAGWVLVMVVLSILIYPVFYDDWLYRNGILPLALAVARNTLLVAFTVWLGWSVVSLSRQGAGEQGVGGRDAAGSVGSAGYAPPGAPKGMS